MYYYFIIALQGFCIYHSIKNRNPYYWIFLIIFLPLLGSIIYILSQVYSKKNGKKLQNEITNIIHPTMKIKGLEKQLEFADTYQNKVNLADAYFELNDFNNAIKYYESSLIGHFKNDFFVMKSLIVCHSKIEEYDKVIFYAEKIVKNPQFKKSYAQLLYGLALEKMEVFDKAETQLEQTNTRFSNYNERVSYANFLLRRNKLERAKEVLEEILSESQKVTKETKREYKTTFIEVEKLLKEM
jgi:hypothetical protein